MTLRIGDEPLLPATLAAAARGGWGRETTDMCDWFAIANSSRRLKL